MAKEQLSLFGEEIKKKCSKCGELKRLDEFYNSKVQKSGRSCACKACDKARHEANREQRIEYLKKYHLENKGRLLQKQKEYRSKNKEKISAHYKEYYSNNKDRLIAYQAEYRGKNKEKVQSRKTKYYFANREEIVAKKKIWAQENISEIRRKGRKYYKEVISKDYRQIIRRRIGNSMRDALISGKNGRTWEDFVDYNVEELINYFKKKDPEIWNKFVEDPSGYHIDHIIPIVAFNFDAPDQIDFKKCFDMKNLQILTVRDNLSKQSKLSVPFQPSLNMSFGQV